MTGKNIWIFNHYSTPPISGTGYRHIKFAQRLMKENNRVSIFAASTVHTTRENLITDNKAYIETESEGIKHIILKARNYTGNGLQRIGNWLDYYLGLFKVSRQFEAPDLIIASSIHLLTCIAGIKIAKKYNIPCIIEIKDLWPKSLICLGKIKEKSLIAQTLYCLEKWIYKKGDAIIFTMEGGKDYIRDRGWDKQIDLSKVYYINNGIDNVENEYKKEKFKIDDPDILNSEVFKVIYTGSVRLANDIGRLVEVAQILEREGYFGKIQILIYGEGNEKEILVERCKSEKIKSIIFKGRVEKEYIPYILSQAQLTVLNYSGKMNVFEYGGSQNKLFEYLAAGKPVLSTIKMNYDILEKFGCGITISGERSEDIAQEIIGFYEMGTKEYKMFCVKALEAAMVYDFSNLEKQLIEVIDRII